MTQLNVCIDVKMKMKQNTKVLSLFYETWLDVIVPAVIIVDLC